MTTAAEYIAGWEGYSGVAYWDVNHWRIGFGSDTEGPDQIDVVEGMTTTKPRALQNLGLRVPQFQNIATRAMGLDTWIALSDAQRIAITSLVYNYGRLPIKIYTSDPDKTASEIAALQSANGGVNRKRRMGEAAYYLTGAHKPPTTSKPEATVIGLTGTSAALLALWTWFNQINGMDRILLALVVIESVLIFYLVYRLLKKQPEVIIHPVPPPEALSEVTRYKQAKANRDVALAALAEAGKEVDNTKQELMQVVLNLQSEIDP